jgi:hypothetical protein
MQPKTVSKAWLGSMTYADSIYCCVNYQGRVEAGVLFKTKKDAKAAGWKTPKRVEITVRPL